MKEAYVDTTDPRLFGIKSLNESTIMGYTHRAFGRMVKDDMKDFLISPTDHNLRAMVQYLLSYQQSALLNRHK